MKETSSVKEKEPLKTSSTPTKREMHPYPFQLLQRDMNQLFENFAHGVEMWRPKFVEPLFGDFQIRLDLKDNETQIVLSAEVPGIEQKDIEVTVTPDSLIISGEKKEEKEEKEKGYYRSERSFGSFHRVIPLPCEVEKDNVEATYKNGVLRIVLPKNKNAIKESKKVEIKSV
ncbi:MAG: Hsp20/alpha crystallin family protein [Candidatus Obscuribacterales bacterium]|nr:Hsp20/alpha crystallin family protein [Candidatus Obscuribacterales bacterium]